MKKLKNKSILQKTIIAIIIVLLFSNFIVPTYSQADIGGVLMDPIVDLLCSIGDVVINLLQVAMTGSDSQDFDAGDGGFLVESTKFFSDSKYDYMKPTEEGEKIYPSDENTGFNKTLLFGTTQDYYIPILTYSPEQIFAGNVAGLDINFIDPNKYTKDDGIEVESTAAKLQPTVASWYVALRNLTIVGLLSVLVYVGIRIIISSTASDKAKYKQMLLDWVIALCLVFFLHYIMSFTLTLVDAITTAIAGDGTDTIVITVDDGNNSGSFKTNLLGSARFKTQYNNFFDKMSYLIMYLALVVYTLIFTWFYLKRLLMMAFLTILAPVVALTYPIDKISDGKSQAFDSWLKEYVFNALIQPFHLIIYTVTVGSAMDLAKTNIVYMIAALAFVLPAEKILRKFFGFEKAGSTLGALAGGAAAASLLGKLGKGRSSGSSGKISGGNSGQEGDKPPRFENKHDISEVDSGDTVRLNSGNEEITTNYDEGVGMKENPKGPRLDIAFGDGSYSSATPRGQNNSGIWIPDSYKQDKQQEAARKKMEQDTARKTEQKQKSVPNNKNNSKLQNWARKRQPLSVAGRAIKGAAKFGTRTAFKAGLGTLAGAVAVASGGGFTGFSAAYMAGSNLGGKLGDGAIKLGSMAGHGVVRGLGAANELRKGNGRSAAADRLLGGTAIGRELDYAHANTRFQDAGNARAIKTDKNNLQFLSDQMEAQSGIRPSMKEVKEKMNDFDPYIAEGLTDIKEMLRAQKAEQYVGNKQAAIIAAIGKEKGITAEILNDEKKYASQRNNMIHEFMSKGNNKKEATKLTDHTMNILKVQNGVAHNLQKPTEQPKTKK